MRRSAQLSRLVTTARLQVESSSRSALGMGRRPHNLIRSEIARVRVATSREFGVNLIPAATDPPA